MLNRGLHLVKQYWSMEIFLVVLYGAISGFIVFLLFSEIVNLPRSSLPFLTTVLSTLLGLTFTAFAIVSAFIPNLSKDFVKTKTFANIGKLFYWTLLLQIISLILSFFSYLLFGTTIYVHLIIITIVATTYSFGFLAYLIHNTFLLFKISRNEVLRKGN